MTDLLVLPSEIDGLIFAALLAASFAGSFITVAFGIGGGAFLIALLATMIPPAALIPVHGVVQLGSNGGRALLMLRHVAWHGVTGILIGTVIGIALGGMIFVEISPRIVQGGLGLFIIWSVFFRPPRWLARWPSITGVISSFLTMFFGATGMFVASYVKSLELDRHRHVATHAVLMTLQHLLKVVAFGILGFAFGPWLLVIAGMVVTGFIGTLVGRVALNHMSDVNFKRALDVILVLISLRLIWAAVTG